jgi:hypothetical protein
MTRIIRPGHTLVAAGTLAAGNTIIVAASNGTGQGGVIDVTSIAANDGTVIFYGGTIADGGGASGTVASGGVLTNNGNIVLRPGGSYGNEYGAGASITVAGVLTNNGQIFVGQSALQPAEGGGASLTIAPGGTLVNADFIALFAGFLGVYRPAGAPPAAVTLSDAGVLTNTGRIMLEPSQPYGAISSVGAVLDVTGVLTNAGQIYLGGGNIGYYSGDTAVGSRLVVEGAAGYLRKSGTIEVRPGSVVSATSSLAGDGAVLQVDAAMVNTGRLLVAGSQGGYVGVPPAGALDVSGSLTNAGYIRIGEGYAQVGSLGGLGGVLDVTGTLFNSGTLVGIGGYGGASPGGGAALDVRLGYNSGSIVLYGGFGGQIAGAGATLTVGAFLENSGYLYVGGGVHAAEVSIASTGYLDDTGTIDGAGTIVNDNIFAFDSNIAIHAGAVVNDGLIDSGIYSNPILAAPLLTSPGSSGTVLIDGGSTLTFLNSVANGQSVVFSNDYAYGGFFPSLALGDAAGFSGVLTDLFAGASIDFLGLDVTAASASGTTLMLDLSGGGTLDLGLGGPLSAGLGFDLSPDGSGGTELTVVSGH